MMEMRCDSPVICPGAFLFAQSVMYRIPLIPLAPLPPPHPRMSAKNVMNAKNRKNFMGA
jgi:hypothetical protein